MRSHLRQKYGCRFVSIKTAARVIGVSEETIMDLVRLHHVRSLPAKGRVARANSELVRVQIPATQRALARQAAAMLTFVGVA